MRTRPLAALLAAVALGSAVHAAPGPKDERDPEAKRLAEKATSHFEAEDYARAAELFEAAHDVDPDPRLLHNVAVSRRRAGHLDRAVSAYERFLKAWPDAPNAGEVRSKLEELRAKRAARYARVTIDSEPSGAVVRLAGREAPLGETPLEVWLPAGERTLRATHDEGEPGERTVELEAGTERGLSFDLSPELAPGRIRLEGAPDGATVTLDGDEVGNVPLDAPIEAAPGSHRVRVAGDDGEPWTREVAVRAEETTTVRIERPEPAGETEGAASAGAPAPTLHADAEAEGFVIPTGTWVAMGLGVAAAGAGTAFAVMARNEAAEARDYARQPNATREAWRRRSDEAEQRSIMANASFGLAGAATAAGVILLVVQQPDDDPSTRTTVAPTAAPDGGAGATVTVDF